MKFIILLSLSFFSFNLWSCDVCGAQINGANGVIPFYTKNQFGLRINQTNLAHPNTPNNYNGTSRILSDRMIRSDIYARFYPTKNWQANVILPLIFSQRKESERTSNVQGLGDLQLQLNRMILNTNDSVKRRYRTVWLAGAGVILPNGKYQQRDETKLMLPIALQPGTGAYQITANHQITIRKDKWGFGNYTNYTLPQQNELIYKVGSSISNSTLLFRVVKINSFQIIPQLGYSFTSKKADKSYEMSIAATQNKLSLLLGGVDVYYKNYLVQVSVNSPVYQRLNYAEPKRKTGFTIGLSYFMVK